MSGCTKQPGQGYVYGADWSEHALADGSSRIGMVDLADFRAKEILTV